MNINLIFNVMGTQDKNQQWDPKNQQRNPQQNPNQPSNQQRNRQEEE